MRWGREYKAEGYVRGCEMPLEAHLVDGQSSTQAFRGKALAKGSGDEDPDLPKGLIYEATLIETLVGAGGDWDAWLQWRKEVT